jgi:hypothetical protein
MPQSLRAMSAAYAESDEVVCAVCLEPGAIAKLDGCSHAFHETCVVKCAHAEMERSCGGRVVGGTYLEALTCPLCRCPSAHYRIGSDAYAIKRATHAPTMFAELQSLALAVERAVLEVVAAKHDQTVLREARRKDQYFKTISDWLMLHCDVVMSAPPLPVD